MNDDAIPCRRCGGEGQRWKVDHDNADSRILTACRNCGGTGQEPDKRPPCTHCNGKGERYYFESRGQEFSGYSPSQVLRKCHHCQGTGQEPDEKPKCANCGDSGWQYLSLSGEDDVRCSVCNPGQEPDKHPPVDMVRLEVLHAEMTQRLAEDGGVWPVCTGDEPAKPRTPAEVLELREWPNQGCCERNWKDQPCDCLKEVESKPRTPAEIIRLRTEGAMYGGCCNRFADNSGCNCLSEALRHIGCGVQGQDLECVGCGEKLYGQQVADVCPYQRR